MSLLAFGQQLQQLTVGMAAVTDSLKALQATMAQLVPGIQPPGAGAPASTILAASVAIPSSVSSIPSIAPAAASPLSPTASSPATASAPSPLDPAVQTVIQQIQQAIAGCNVLGAVPNVILLPVIVPSASSSSLNANSNSDDSDGESKAPPPSSSFSSSSSSLRSRTRDWHRPRRLSTPIEECHAVVDRDAPETDGAASPAITAAAASASPLQEASGVDVEDTSSVVSSPGQFSRSLAFSRTSSMIHPALLAAVHRGSTLQQHQRFREAPESMSPRQQPAAPPARQRRFSMTVVEDMKSKGLTSLPSSFSLIQGSPSPAPFGRPPMAPLTPGGYRSPTAGSQPARVSITSPGSLDDDAAAAAAAADAATVQSHIFLDYDNKIKLNVGGQIFFTTLSTLTRTPSFFQGMFSGSFTLERDANDAYFIDRDPTYFRYVLNFLRDGSVDISEMTLTDKKSLLSEAKYYQVPALIQQLQSSTRASRASLRSELSSEKEYKCLTNIKEGNLQQVITDMTMNHGFDFEGWTTSKSSKGAMHVLFSKKLSRGELALLDRLQSHM